MLLGHLTKILSFWSYRTLILSNSQVGEDQAAVLHCRDSKELIATIHEQLSVAEFGIGQKVSLDIFIVTWSNKRNIYLSLEIESEADVTKICP
ncbi:hypothetical protein P8452_09523 [Trifolium repens]|nr:hypothetical protein P8452_09523 [Trifolium repens]